MLANLPWFKIVGIGLILIILSSTILYIQLQKSKIESLQSQLKSSETVNAILNDTIRQQNESINISNAKYEEVQKQLNASAKFNDTIRQEFKSLRKDLNKKPVPATCEEANQEMINTGKVLSEKWKK